MRLDPHVAVQIAALTVLRRGLALSANADRLPIVNAHGYLDVDHPLLGRPAGAATVGAWVGDA